MTGIFKGAFSGAVSRLFKRQANEGVEANDYRLLWAETTEDGVECITEVAPDKNPLRPDFRLIAHKFGHGDQWRVTKEKLFINMDLSSPFHLAGRPTILLEPQHYGQYDYETIHDYGQMDECEMVAMLKAADTTQRHVGHISGVTVLPSPKEPFPAALQFIVDEANRYGHRVTREKDGGIAVSRHTLAAHVVDWYGPEGQRQGQAGPWLSMF